MLAQTSVIIVNESKIFSDFEKLSKQGISMINNSMDKIDVKNHTENASQFSRKMDDRWLEDIRKVDPQYKN